MTRIFFSWDDGHPDDFKIKDLFEKYEIPAILFIPKNNLENEVVSEIDIKKLFSSIINIGAHTYNHSYLTELTKDQIIIELEIGKKYLENILTMPIKDFCLPGGKYNKFIIQQGLKYYSTIRTAKTLCVHPSLPIIDTTFHFYPRGKKSLLYNSFINEMSIFPYIALNIKKYSYFSIIKHFIEYSIVNNKCHDIMIWGHSWELSKMDLWKELESLLIFINKNYKSNCFSYSALIKN